MHRTTSHLVALPLPLYAMLVAAAAHAQTDACAIAGFSAAPRVSPDDVLAQWNADAAALGELGADATFDLAATELHVTLDVPAQLASPSSPARLLSIQSDFAITDAVMNGVTGRVEVTGGFAQLGGGPAGGLTLGAADITAVDVAGGAVAVRGNESATATLAGATLSGYQSATFTPSGGANGGSPTALPAGGFTLEGGSAIAAIDGHGVLAFGVDAVTIVTGGFALAGDFTDQTVVVDGAPIAPARSLVGRSSSLHIDARGVDGTARVTQVFDDEAPRMQADVEIMAFAPLVAVASGGSINVPMLVRNKSAQAVGIVKSIEVDGCAASAVTPVVDDALPSFVTTLVGVIQQSGWAAPFVAIALAPVLGVAIVVDAFVDVANAFVDVVGDILCGIFGCGNDTPAPPPPTPPVPFPKWLEPGAVVPFEVALLPDLADGDYPVRVRFVGENYAEVAVDFTLRIGRGDEPAAWICEPGQYGAADGCDCGCGAVDADCPANATANDCGTSMCGADLTLLSDDTATCNFPQPPASGPPPSSSSSNDGDGDGGALHFACGAAPASTTPCALCCLVLACATARRQRSRQGRSI